MIATLKGMQLFVNMECIYTEMILKNGFNILLVASDNRSKRVKHNISQGISYYLNLTLFFFRIMIRMFHYSCIFRLSNLYNIINNPAIGEQQFVRIA